jgi:uncharacterized protein with PhoU and TrkA domain
VSCRRGRGVWVEEPDEPWLIRLGVILVATGKQSDF